LTFDPSLGSWECTGVREHRNWYNVGHWYSSQHPVNINLRENLIPMTVYALECKHTGVSDCDHVVQHQLIVHMAAVHHGDLLHGVTLRLC